MQAAQVMGSALNYLRPRLIDDTGQVRVSFVCGNDWVAPLKPVKTPHPELTAAVVSTSVSATLSVELQYEEVTEYFWTDSQIVLGYIKNDSRRYKPLWLTGFRAFVIDRSCPSGDTLRVRTTLLARHQEGCLPSSCRLL